MEEILERQLVIRGRAFATFSIIEILRGSHVVQAWSKPLKFHSIIQDGQAAALELSEKLYICFSVLLQNGTVVSTVPYSTCKSFQKELMSQKRRLQINSYF